jgi:2-polyprenyl-6-methoxyphenol hydroxylase-like FAD-dependent oxidoreductase
MDRIVIIGGGIGGLTVALALEEFGFACEVFEQAPELLDVGAAIAIWPNAMRILERLQLADRILDRAGEMEEIRWLDQHGNLINRVAIWESREQRTSPAVALHRADLQSILLHALPPESINLGYSLVDYERSGENRVIAKFANGQNIETGFLIGADGIHSDVRSQLLHDEPPLDRGYTVWRGIAPFVPKLIPPATAIELHGRGKRFGIGPVGLGRVGWWAAANVAPPSHVPHEKRAELLRLFAGWYAPVVELIEATPAASILETRAFDRLSSRKWGSDRITLLGDAIHPTTPNLGQGGCLAMEDALVLARCVQKYGVTNEALRKYESCRYRRTAAITSYSRYYGMVGQWENILARGLRRTALALAPEALVRELVHTVFEYDANAAPI